VWSGGRGRAVARRLPWRRLATDLHAPAPGILPERGYAVALTGSTAETGLFPTPQGVVVVGMTGAAEAGRALPSLFPPGAREAAAAGTRALSTRESFPLTGEFQLWGAAVGRNLVFATDSALIDLASDDPARPLADEAAAPPWRVSTLAAISMEQALPLLRRWGVPISGLVAARWPAAPDLTRDIDLLAAVRTVRVTAGADTRRRRVAITLTVGDLR